MKWTTLHFDFVVAQQLDLLVATWLDVEPREIGVSGFLAAIRPQVVVAVVDFR